MSSSRRNNNVGGDYYLDQEDDNHFGFSTSSLPFPPPAPAPLYEDEEFMMAVTRAARGDGLFHPRIFDEGEVERGVGQVGGGRGQQQRRHVSFVRKVVSLRPVAPIQATHEMMEAGYRVPPPLELYRGVCGLVYMPHGTPIHVVLEQVEGDTTSALAPRNSFLYPDTPEEHYVIKQRLHECFQTSWGTDLVYRNVSVFEFDPTDDLSGFDGDIQQVSGVVTRAPLNFYPPEYVINQELNPTNARAPFYVTDGDVPESPQPRATAAAVTSTSSVQAVSSGVEDKDIKITLGPAPAEVTSLKSKKVKKPHPNRPWGNGDIIIWPERRDVYDDLDNCMGEEWKYAGSSASEDGDDDEEEKHQEKPKFSASMNALIAEAEMRAVEAAVANILMEKRSRIRNYYSNQRQAQRPGGRQGPSTPTTNNNTNPFMYSLQRAARRNYPEVVQVDGARATRTSTS